MSLVRMLAYHLPLQLNAKSFLLSMPHRCLFCSIALHTFYPLGSPPSNSTFMRTSHLYTSTSAIYATSKPFGADDIDEGGSLPVGAKVGILIGIPTGIVVVMRIVGFYLAQRILKETWILLSALWLVVCECAIQRICLFRWRACSMM